MSDNENPLKSWTVGKLVNSKRTLVAIREDKSVADALDTLKEHNILSLPVVAEDEKTFIGIINIFDIMTFVAFGCFKWNKPEPSFFETFHSMQTTVKDILEGLSEDGRESSTLWETDENTSIADILEPMSKGVHRYLISFEEEGSTVKRLLSQTDVVRFLFEFKDHYKTEVDCNASIKDLGLVWDKKLETITDECTAIDGFRKMQLTNKLALPIVSKYSGKLIGTLSSSDLRGMSGMMLKTVLFPVIQYLKLGRSLDGFKKPISVTPNCSLATVMQKCLLHRIHRVWVVGAEGTAEAGKPIGAVSLSDIICKFSPYDFQKVFGE